MAALAAFVHRTICALRGHDVVLQLGDARMFLRCVTCGHESPGWKFVEFAK